MLKSFRVFYKYYDGACNEEGDWDCLAVDTEQASRIALLEFKHFKGFYVTEVWEI